MHLRDSGLSLSRTSRRGLLALASILVFGSLAGSAGAAVDPTLVGDWSFDSPTSGDSSGHWSSFDLKGAATVSGGRLQVAGSGNGGNAASAWGRAAGYSGPTISDKTLISWVSLDALTQTGSPMSLNTRRPGSPDVFDSIVYSEAQYLAWTPGSDYGRRNGPFYGSPQDTDTAAGNMRQVAISYRSIGGGAQVVTGCLNGTQIGQYTTGTTTFDGSTAVAVFGPRHIETDVYGNDTPIGSITAHIDESRIYSRAIPCAGVGDSDADHVLAETDNCPSVANAGQVDTDGDGQGDACDATPNGDDDNDGVDNATDNCRAVANSDQADLDGDGVGDACDPDIDGDGVSNSQDDFPRDPAESVDTDGDGIGNNADTDDDNDGVLDSADSAPLDPANARPSSTSACKAGGWTQFMVNGTRFKNQGDCVSWVSTAGRNAPAGR